MTVKNVLAPMHATFALEIQKMKPLGRIQGTLDRAPLRQMSRRHNFWNGCERQSSEENMTTRQGTPVRLAAAFECSFAITTTEAAGQGLSGSSSVNADLEPGGGFTDPQSRSVSPRNVAPGWFA